jgi:nucleoside-diphosphate-sugar epimerase
VLHENDRRDQPSDGEASGTPVTPRRVAVIGAAGPVGRRVVEQLARHPDVVEVRAFDLFKGGVRPGDVRIAAGPFAEVRSERLDLATVDQASLAAVLDGVDSVVHLAFSADTEHDPDVARRLNIGGTERLLHVLDDGGPRHLVALSSAAVYGAWPTNPVPLTEDAPLRPVPEFTYAVHKAAVEHLVDDWRSHATNRSAPRTAAILRPATALAERDRSWLAGALADAVRISTGDADPPRQFLHLDDLAAAVVLAVIDRLDGPLNVAPDGWLPAEEVRALIGGPPRLRLPERVAMRLTRWSWQLRRGPVPPGLVPYTMHPWVISNDRLRAAGWQPTSSNAEAFVAGTDAKWWQTVSPQRRQELALGAAGAVLAAAAGTAFVVVRRIRRGRQS